MERKVEEGGKLGKKLEMREQVEGKRSYVHISEWETEVREQGVEEDTRRQGWPPPLARG